MGVGEAVANPKLIDSAVVEMTAITGQKAGGHQSEEGDCDLQAP